MIKLAAMRSAGLLLVVAACGFHGSAPPAQDQPPADADAPDSSGVAVDAGPAPDATATAFCAVVGIVACYEFEGNAKDGSGNALRTTVNGVSFVPGVQTGMAMQVDDHSTTNVDPSILFDDVTALTIEAWIKPSQLPANKQQSDILDVDNQYSFAVNDDGTLTCDLHSAGLKLSTPPARTVAVNRWTHVACTYDGTAGAVIYIDGGAAASHAANGALAAGNNAMSIATNNPMGQQLIGAIDQVRLLNVARSAADICTDAGALCISL